MSAAPAARTIESGLLRRTLLRIVAVLMALSVVAGCARGLAPDSTTANGLHFLDANLEATIPALFSALLLFACAAVAAAIAARDGRFERLWWLLAIALAALGLDEAVAIHELTAEPLRNFLDSGGALYYAWVVPGAVIAVAVVLLFTPLAGDLAPAQRRLFVAGALLFLGGAVGVELVEGWLVDRYGEGDIATVPAVTVQETAEMVGAVLFLHALMERLGPWAGTLRLSPR